MAGLALGTMSLSIWAPVSQTAAQEENKYFTFHWAVNSNIANAILLFN